MKVVIDIDEAVYEDAMNDIPNGLCRYSNKAIRNGTPISTEGDLISRSALKREFETTPYNDYDDLLRTEHLIDNAPTVIDADNNEVD